MRGLTGLLQQMQALGAARDLEDILAVVLNHIADALGDIPVAILMLEPATHGWHLGVSRGLTPEQIAEFRRPQQMPAHHPQFMATLATGALWEVSDAAQVDDMPPALREAHQPLFTLPLIVQGTPMGLIMAAAAIPDDETRDWLRIVAGQAACAIQRAWQREQSRQHSQLVDTIRALDQQITTHPELDDFLPDAARLISANFQYHCVAIYLRREHDYMVYQVVRGAHGLSVAALIGSQVGVQQQANHSQDAI